MKNSAQRDKSAGKWYNLTVQVAAGQTIKYTAELRHRHESRYLSAGGVFVWSSGLNEQLWCIT